MSSTSMKKRLDEKNSKLIRELSALPENRHCFECGQRGPTYVNVTEGSFCCTACSGILRGLNPPHRVKSISMATFTTEEVEKVRRLGNSENIKTWMGLYDSNSPTISNKDELHSFLVKKYEKKAWYVSPEELAEQERLISKAKKVATLDSTSGPPTSILDIAIPKTNSVDLFAADPFDALTNKANSPRSMQFSGSTPFSPPAFLAPGTHKMENNVADLLFAEPLPSLKTLNLSDVNTVPVFGNSQFGNLRSINLLTNRAIPENPFIANVTQVDISTASVPDVPPNSATTIPVKNREQEIGGDKYSALAELDEMFHKHPQPGNPVNAKPHWMPSGFSTGVPPINHHPRSTMMAASSESQFQTQILPKSNTMGALSEYHGVNPFLDKKRSTLTGSMTISNPFLSTGMPWSNAVSNPPPIPPRPQHSEWTANFEQQANSKSANLDASWNPFL